MERVQIQTFPLRLEERPFTGSFVLQSKELIGPQLEAVKTIVNELALKTQDFIMSTFNITSVPDDLNDFVRKGLLNSTISQDQIQSVAAFATESQKSYIAGKSLAGLTLTCHPLICAVLGV